MKYAQKYFHILDGKKVYFEQCFEVPEFDELAFCIPLVVQKYTSRNNVLPLGNKFTNIT